MKLLIAIVLVTAATCFSQTGAKAAVYVYGLDASSVGHLRKPVLVDGKAVANASPKRYFIILVDAGMHTISFENKKWGGIEKDFKAGSISYLRVGWVAGLTVRPNGIDLVAPEVGAFDVKQLKPIDKEQIKDKAVAVLELPEMK